MTSGEGAESGEGSRCSVRQSVGVGMGKHGEGGKKGSESEVGSKGGGKGR